MMRRSTLTLLSLSIVVVTCQQDFKCPSGTGYFPDEYQCDLYYKCSKGKAEVKLCPDGLVFKDNDPNLERCEIPANVDCGDRTELQEAKSSKGCPRANGYYRHTDPELCGKFYNCVEGKPYEQSCPPGLIYDDLGGSTCVWPNSAKRRDCDNTKRETLEGFSCPIEPVMGNNGRPLPHPTYPHPTDCSLFYICRGGQAPTLGSCSGGSVYNEVTFACDSPENVPGCENPSKNK